MTTGNSCRLGSANVAEARAGANTGARSAVPKSRLPKTAQLPPATLFAALSRAISRRAVRAVAASGTRLATRPHTD